MGIVTKNMLIIGATIILLAVISCLPGAEWIWALPFITIVVWVIHPVLIKMNPFLLVAYNMFLCLISSVFTVMLPSSDAGYDNEGGGVITLVYFLIMIIVLSKNTHFIIYYRHQLNMNIKKYLFYFVFMAVIVYTHFWLISSLYSWRLARIEELG